MAAESVTYSRTRLALGYVGWWLFWSLLQTFVLHRLALSWKISVIDSVVSNAVLGFLTLTSLLIYRYYQPGKQNRYYRLIYALGITLIFCAILGWILPRLLPGEPEYRLLVERSMPLRFIVAFMIISLVTIMNWLWNSLEEQKLVVMRKTESEQLAKEAELARLRQQLQPHFLFNSLNSISALLLSSPEEARRMLQQLSDFLRATLRKDEESNIPFSDELGQLGLYLEIEKVRFGNRLNVQINVESPALEKQIPPLLLQPIMENAIKFGVYGTLGQVNIQLSARSVGQMLKIDVSNPYEVEAHQQKNGTGFGLSSIARRLYLLFGRNDLLFTHSENGIFTTTLRIPQ